MSRNILQKTQFQTSNIPYLQLLEQTLIEILHTLNLLQAYKLYLQILRTHIPIIQFPHPHYLSLQF